MLPPGYQITRTPIGHLYRALFGYGAGYGGGSRVVPIPNENYRAAKSPRKHWPIALNSYAHLLPAYRRLPGFLAIATSLSFRDGRLKRHHQNPGSRRYRPAHRAYRRGSGSADRFGQQVRAKLAFRVPCHGNDSLPE